MEIKGRTLICRSGDCLPRCAPLQKELDDASEALGAAQGTPEYEDALEVFGDLQIRLEHHDVSRMKPRIERECSRG